MALKVLVLICGSNGQFVNTSEIIFISRPLVVHTAPKHMKMTRTTTRLGGFTLVEIMIVVALIGLLCAIAIPNYVRARTSSQANACINNLRQIDSAMQQFAIEYNKHLGATVNFPADLTPYLKLNSNSQIPGCPAGGTYSVGAVGVDPSVICSLGNTVSPPHSY